MSPNIATPQEEHQAYCGKYTSGREGDVIRCRHGVIYCFDAYWTTWRVLRVPRWYSFPVTRRRYAAALEVLGDDAR